MVGVKKKGSLQVVPASSRRGQTAGSGNMGQVPQTERRRGKGEGQPHRAGGKCTAKPPGEAAILHQKKGLNWDARKKPVHKKAAWQSTSPWPRN